MSWSFKSIGHEDTYEIRHKVLWPEKSIEHVKLEGDESALHIGVFVDERQVGVVSLFRDEKSFQFRKLAVLPEFRGFGAGTALIGVCMAIASKLGAETLWCDARQTAMDFYKSLGFEIDPKVFPKSDVFYQKAIAHPPYPEISLKEAFKEPFAEIETAKCRYFQEFYDAT